MTQPHHVFLTGATGYIGSRLAAELVRRGHLVRALVRPDSESRRPAGTVPVLGDALDRTTYAGQVAPADTFVHLVGVSHPGPAKADQFQSIDLASAREAVAAAQGAQIRHFVYISVAHPAPVMKEYIAARSEAETLIRASGMNATVLRPWYVLGPGHRWPILLLPLYWLGELVPATRAGARRLGLVTLQQTIDALVRAVEDPPSGMRIVAVPDIRGARPLRPSVRLPIRPSQSAGM
jgi:uncharacterized protein YbjT (DUF2867 family)